MHHSFPMSDLMFLTQLQLCVCLFPSVYHQANPGSSSPGAACDTDALQEPGIGGCPIPTLQNAEPVELVLLSSGMWVLCCRWDFVFVNKLKESEQAAHGESGDSGVVALQVVGDKGLTLWLLGFWVLQEKQVISYFFLPICLKTDSIWLSAALKWKLKQFSFSGFSDHCTARCS